MENQRKVICQENEDLASFLWKKRKDMAEPNGISENLDLTLSKAYRNICDSKSHIKTLKDLSQVKGVGKWIIRLLQSYFGTESRSEDSTQNEKNNKGSKRYVPQKNSAAYAILITLYRETAGETGFMRKQELIDAAEASGLSRVSIGPEKGIGKPSQSSSRDWYIGWNCMKTLVMKGLVAKSSCPAKYMLTQEGQEAARECLLRSGLTDDPVATRQGNHASCPFVDLNDRILGDQCSAPLSLHTSTDIGGESNLPKRNLQERERGSTAKRKRRKNEQAPSHSNFCSSFLACEDQVDMVAEEDNRLELTTRSLQNGLSSSCSAESTLRPFVLQACISSDYHMHGPLGADHQESTMHPLAMPPRRFGEKFDDTYDVVLILDDRERFAQNKQGSHSRRFVENMRSQFRIQVEVRRLPVGDGIWIARHKHINTEHVLDFIVERKNVNDLSSSIRDNRYRDQKLRLLRCGLQKLIYLVEGDPNSLETAESIKTACFTTEILEGFDVIRTNSLSDTMRKYGYLTQAITDYYGTQFSKEINENRICPTFSEFNKKCQDLEKMTVSDVFAVQLMQVPQVTEEVALAVVDLYPTVLSLAQAYSLIEGDVQAQEEMLKHKSTVINASASKNIFSLVWGG